MKNKLAKPMMLTLATIAVAAGVAACDFRNPEGGQIHMAPILPTPAVLTSTP